MAPDIIYVPRARHGLPTQHSSSRSSDLSPKDSNPSSDGSDSFSDASNPSSHDSGPSLISTDPSSCLAGSSSGGSRPFSRDSNPSSVSTDPNSIHSNPSVTGSAALPSLGVQDSDSKRASKPTHSPIHSADGSPFSSPRAFSSPFFAPVESAELSRHSSLHLYPQHIFPSKLNGLPEDMEVPYAFSHLQATFHWTREDALADRKLNIWATPPCLNCVLLGASFAKSCNRHIRQETTMGRTRCCSKCERDGGADGCVEQIEIRMDGKLNQVEADGTERSIWDGVEQSLRQTGRVFWTPINLDIGNTSLKQTAIELWKESKQAPTYALPQAGLNAQRITKEHKDEEKKRQEEGVEHRIRGRELAQEVVAGWDEEDLASEPSRLIARLAREEQRTIEQTMQHSPADRDVRARAVADDQEFWTNRVRAEAYERFEDGLAGELQETWQGGKPLTAADKTTAVQQEERVVARLRMFLARVSQLVDGGVSGADAVRRGQAEMPQDVVKSLEVLVPEVFRPEARRR